LVQPGDQKKAILYALAAVLFWSTVPTAFKLGLRYQDNFQMLAGASIVSTIVLAVTLLVQKKTFLLKQLKTRDILRAALLGILNPAIYYLILFRAYDLLPAQVAQPLNMTWPIVLVIISIPLLKQKTSWMSLLSLFISFGGIVVLSLQGGSIFTEESLFTGVLLALCSAAIWAFYWILNMKSRVDEVLGLFMIFLFSTSYLLLMGIFRESALPTGKEAWLSSIYIGIFEMGLAFVFWLRALQLSSTTAKISNLVFIAPFLNLIFVSLILGESIYISTIFGIVLVIAGILIQNRSTRKNA